MVQLRRKKIILQSNNEAEGSEYTRVFQEGTTWVVLSFIIESTASSHVSPRINYHNPSSPEDTSEKREKAVNEKTELVVVATRLSRVVWWYLFNRIT